MEINKNWILRLSGAIALILGASLAFAGGVHDGGGKVMVCKYGKKTKVELLDLWEGQRLPPYYKPSESRSSVEAQVSAAIDRMKFVIDYSGSGDGNQTSAEALKERLENEVSIVMGKPKRPNPWTPRVEFVVNGGLPETDDVLPRVQPKHGEDCHTEQAIRYYDAGSRIRIDKELTSQMSKTQLAALYLHEALYAVLRMPNISDENTSIRVRMAVAYVMSGLRFPDMMQELPKRRILCTSTEPFSTRFYVAIDNNGPYIYSSKVGQIAMMGPNKYHIPFEAFGLGRQASLEDLAKKLHGCFGFGDLDAPIDYALHFSSNFCDREDSFDIHIDRTADGYHLEARDTITCRLDDVQ